MIRGRLSAKAVDGKLIRVYFMQRGSSPEDENVPVKIYRRLADEINFSTGMAGDAPGFWTEYVDNQKWTDERVNLVFEGQLPYTHSFCEYRDEDVAIGHTYLYWVIADSFGEHIEIGPVACKLRDPEVWWGYERSVKEMTKLRDDYKDIIEMVQYGESTRHRPIIGLKIGNRERTIALAGAIHASEPGPELLTKALRFILKTRPELLEKIGLAVVPAINVDVREETVEGEPFYLRKNPNQVDLNRNFDWIWKEEFVYGYSNTMLESSTYHGPYPASENETKAAMAFIQDVNPVALFVFDSNSVITEDLLLLGSHEGDESFERDNEIATLYSKAFRENHPECGTFTARPLSYPVTGLKAFAGTGQPHGTFEGWTHGTFNVPAFSLQTASSKEGSVSSDDAVSRELLDQWSRRHAYALIAMLEEFSMQ